MLLLPFIELGTDVLEVFGSFGNLFCLDTGFLLLPVLLDPLGEHVEQFELYGGSDLEASAIWILRGGGHAYKDDSSEYAELDHHRLC